MGLDQSARNPRRRKTVAVVYGGRSGEHEISIRSAQSIVHAIDRAKYDVRQIFITPEGRWEPGPILPEPGANHGIDVVFPILHGTFGEDGTVQGLLELADLPYVGAGVLGSAAAMDKEVAKRLLRERGLPTAESVILNNGAALDAQQVGERLGWPVFVKPVNLGSSVGVSKAANPDELADAFALAGKYDRKVLIERAITGREFECSVLGNRDVRASMPCEVLPSRDFYDYDDKYVLNKTEFRLPAALPQAEIEEMRRLAVAAFLAVEAEGMARVDFLREEATGKLYVNEVNTIPGFTSISMFPKMWEHSGISYSELIDRLIELAFERHADKQRLRYAR